MESHTFTLGELPGVTFTATRGGEEPPPPVEGEMPPEPTPAAWLTLEARTVGGDIVMSGGMLGPEPTPEESTE
ncbi:hypothetical protein [Williamsia sp.]|uniref:hypothetical protein n=1 Tax=Williamsia sp. TaxID=1872085 RepID=UPI002F9421E2